jgi:hypothetical protein
MQPRPVKWIKVWQGVILWMCPLLACVPQPQDDGAETGGTDPLPIGGGSETDSGDGESGTGGRDVQRVASATCESDALFYGYDLYFESDPSGNSRLKDIGIRCAGIQGSDFGIQIYWMLTRESRISAFTWPQSNPVDLPSTSAIVSLQLGKVNGLFCGITQTNEQPTGADGNPCSGTDYTRIRHECTSDGDSDAKAAGITLTSIDSDGFITGLRLVKRDGSLCPPPVEVTRGSE